MTATDLTGFIKQDGKELLTDMRAVAIAFGKQHVHVMRTVKNKLASKHPLIAEHARSNFGARFHLDSNWQRRSLCPMTAKRLSELTMGLSGADEQGCPPICGDFLRRVERRDVPYVPHDQGLLSVFGGSHGRQEGWRAGFQAGSFQRDCNAKGGRALVSEIG